MQNSADHQMLFSEIQDSFESNFFFSEAPSQQIIDNNNSSFHDESVKRTSLIEGGKKRMIRDGKTAATQNVAPQNWKLITIGIRFCSSLSRAVSVIIEFFETRFCWDSNFWSSF